LIIDASVGVKWLVPEGDAQAAAALLDHLTLYVPTLFFSEVGNALVKKARRGEIFLDRVAQTFAELPQLVTVRNEEAAMPRALHIATVLSHSFYDCVYLALAEIEGAPLITADIKFAQKVAQTEWASLIRTL
jgi:predicted nucleic acid-binding protein